jgi:hypothetical protein
VDEQELRTYSAMSPQEYFQLASQIEEKGLAEFARNVPYEQKCVVSYNAEVQLRPVLERFYQVGAQLYGVSLAAENFAVVPSMDVNAFASGSRLFVNEGLIRYFLRPTDYVVGIVAAQMGGRVSPEQYRALQVNFGWQNDWNSIYFVLAHEAAHNLMRHRDKAVLVRLDTMLNDYRQAVFDHRKDVAHGRKGGGVKRYLWRSLKNFAEEFQSAEQQRGKEAEADAVALLLLQRAGFNPAIALAAGQKMAMLLGGRGVAGWQGAMTEVLCSSHPDWMMRIQNMQTELNCVQFTGRLCQEHTPYAVETFLSKLRDGMASLDAYQEETVRIAEAAGPSSGQAFEAQIEVNPKDARLEVDGHIVSPGKVTLSVGPHTLEAAKDGYNTRDLRIVVYPDVQPKVKIKLKKSKG